MSLMETWEFWIGLAAYSVVCVIGVFRSRKQSDPLLRTIISFKYSCLAFALLLLSLGLLLPFTGFWASELPFKPESLQDISIYQQRLGSDLNRVREVVEWTLRFGSIWLIVMFFLAASLAKELINKRSGA